MSNQNEVIKFDSEEAAHLVHNISGWVSRNGRFYGNDERAARYDGCTHMICEDCGDICRKSYLICDKCNEIRERDKYAVMPKEVWDETGMLYSTHTDHYYSSWEEAEEDAFEEGIKLEDMRLVICEPGYLPLLNYDYGCDSLAEDGELPDAVVEAMEKFNQVIKETGPVSWWPGKKAALKS